MMRKVPPPIHHSTVFNLNENAEELEKEAVKSAAARRKSLQATVSLIDDRSIHAGRKAQKAGPISMEAKSSLVRELASILTLYTSQPSQQAGQLSFMEVFKDANIKWVANHINKCKLQTDECDCAQQERRTIYTLMECDEDIHGTPWVTSPRSLMALLRHGIHPRALVKRTTQSYANESLAGGEAASPHGLRHRITKREKERVLLADTLLKEYNEICSAVSTKELLEGLAYESSKERTAETAPTAQEWSPPRAHSRLQAAKASLKRQITGVIDSQTRQLVTKWEDDKKSLSLELMARTRINKVSRTPVPRSTPKIPLPDVPTKSKTPAPTPTPTFVHEKEKKGADVTLKLKMVKERREEAMKQRVAQMEEGIIAKDEKVQHAAQERRSKREYEQEEFRQRLRSRRALMERNALVSDYQKLQYVSRQSTKEENQVISAAKAQREIESARQELQRMERERKKALGEVDHWRINLEKQMAFEHLNVIDPSPARRCVLTSPQKDTVENFIHSSLRLKSKIDKM